MKLRYARIMGITWAAVLLVTIMVVPAVAYSPSVDLSRGAAPLWAIRAQQNPTPTATTSTAEGAQGDPTASPVTVEPANDSGDAIRQRVYSTAIAGAVIAVSTLILLWAYTALSDPVRRHRASTRIRQLRREERRDRTRRRQRE